MPAIPAVAAFVATSAFDVGIMGATLIGAAAGGIVAAVKGEDILKGALVGGVSGAVVGWAAKPEPTFGSDAASLAHAESEAGIASASDVAGTTVADTGTNGLIKAAESGAYNTGKLAGADSMNTATGLMSHPELASDTTKLAAAEKGIAGGGEVASSASGEVAKDMSSQIAKGTLGNVTNKAPSSTNLLNDIKGGFKNVGDKASSFWGSLDAGEKMLGMSMITQGLGSALAPDPGEAAAKAQKDRFNAIQLNNNMSGKTGLTLTGKPADVPNYQQPQIQRNAGYTGGLLNAATKYRF